MTDPITCPECDGRKGDRLGELFLACRFCGGLGWVGGEHEPAERRLRPPPEPPPAWRHPALAGTGLCGYCLGSGQVIALGGGEQQATSITMAPCPAACTTPPT
ncbi:hypothetical protein [Streptosporangium sp. KLBMP 9127]|nr:hypothetical protein [Streptosporangium sp. KLBMP 9127]